MNGRPQPPLRPATPLTDSLTDPRDRRPVPGAWSSTLSPAPLTEARRFNFELGGYWSEKHAAAGGAPVFKLHAGLRTIAFTDHATAEFFFDAPRDVLERERLQRFGPLALRQALTGGCHPALVSSGEQHDRSRALTDSILRARGRAFPGALEAVMERALCDWTDRGGVALFEGLTELTGRFAFRWLLDVEPELEQVVAWQDWISTIVTDSAVASALGRVVLPRAPASARRAAEALRALALGSPLYDRYRELARDAGVDEAELADFLVFLCAFNGSGAVTHSLFPSIVRLSVDAAAREALLEELDGGDLSFRRVAGLPWLDAVHSECMRLYTRPRLFYKRAVCDLGLPTHGGDRYAIAAGDLLVATMPVVHRDPRVFDDPEAFDPRRFLEDPALKGRVWGYGRSLASKNPYGCAAAASGHAPMLWKLVVARLFSARRWSLLQAPEFDVDHFFEVAPKGIVLDGFGPRGEGDGDEGGDLSDRFRDATAAVRGLQVGFDRPTYMRLYGLYKQALGGDVQGSRPGALQVMERTKWDAWSAQSGLGRREAMARYVEIVEARAAPKRPAKPVAETDAPDDTSIPCAVDPDPEGEADALGWEVALDLTLIGAERAALAIAIEGDMGRTPPIRAELAAGPGGDVRGTLRFDARHVGRPYLIRMDLAGEGECRIGALRVELSEVGAGWDFLVHRHLDLPAADALLFESSGALDADAPPGLSAARAEEIARQRARWGWRRDPDHDLPAFSDCAGYAALPREERFERKHEWVSLSVMNPESEDETPVPEPDVISGYARLLAGRDAPAVFARGRWRDDAEFGRALLQGSHCTWVRRCDALPEGFEPLLDAPGADALEADRAAGRLFVADYPQMDEVTPYPGRFVAAPTALLRAVPGDGALLPVAIRITREPGAPIFTPDDAPLDWMVAKMWARMADVCTQVLSSHLLECHAMIEAFAVSAWRNLPTSHPIHQLLAPHLRHCVAINALAREYLICPGGLVDSFLSTAGGGHMELMQTRYRELSLRDTMSLPRDLAARGVDDLAALPDYPYRDDGLLVWRAISDFTAQVVRAFYSDDQRVRDDAALQAWMREFNAEGVPRSDLPDAIDSREALSELLTGILFTASARHATHNYMQYDTYAFVPFSPATLCAPPITEKGEATIEHLRRLLPSEALAKRSVHVTVVLSMHFDEDLPLGGDERVLFARPEARLALARFRRQLQRIDQQIAQRDAARPVPYGALRPSQVPNGVVL